MFAAAHVVAWQTVVKHDVLFALAVPFVAVKKVRVVAADGWLEQAVFWSMESVVAAAVLSAAGVCVATDVLLRRRFVAADVVLLQPCCSAGVLLLQTCLLQADCWLQAGCC
uniref:Uncharacterized protein n=1 Tax=Knipowitschia caucasica TaxID=637954 RepID=A0AAV2M2I0_KNICA